MLIGIIGVSSDITEHKCAETALKKLNAELTKRNAEKDKFLSIIAHDLKSPFLGFLGLTQDINKNASNISVQELTQMGMTMYQATDNLFKLLQNLLEWAQMQKGSMSFQPKEFSLSELITENVQTMKKRSEQKEVAIINTVVGSFKAYADEKMIKSVLLNLLSNAVKFTQRNGAVTISVTMSKNQIIEISIGDTGIGMPKNLVEKLFEVGEKTGRKGTEGELSTGLGLLLCKEFVEKNGGKIWVDSEEGKGSIFYFTLQSTFKNT